MNKSQAVPLYRYNALRNDLEDADALIKELKAKVAELEDDVNHEAQRSEFYKGEFLCRKGNKVALEKFDEFKSKLSADAILKLANDECPLDSSIVTKSELIDYAEKLRAGDL